MFSSLRTLSALPLLAMLLAAGASAQSLVEEAPAGIHSNEAGGGLAYRVLATNRTSTLEKELNQAAADGFEFVDMMGGETLGGDEVVTVTAKPAGAPSERNFEYKLLATKKTSTMQKELTAAGELGYRYCGQSVAKTMFGGQEVVVVLKRSTTEPGRRYAYRLLATKRTKTMGKELNEAGAEGFLLLETTVSTTTFGGQELVSILMRED